MARLLIVSHCPSANSRALAEAVFHGARSAAEDNFSIDFKSAFDAGPEDVHACGAIALGTTENFGYMNGALKDFFERIYYPCLEQTQGLPYALFVKAGNDGSGAVSSVERIVAGLRWRAVAPPLVCVGPPDDIAMGRFSELGATLAAGLEAGLW